MSTTPRTDSKARVEHIWNERAYRDEGLPVLEIVEADFARILETENAALRAQIHDLCHDKHLVGAPVTPQEFCNGCEAYQVKLFGESPIAKLRELLRRAWEFPECSVRSFNTYNINTLDALRKWRQDKAKLEAEIEAALRP